MIEEQLLPTSQKESNSEPNGDDAMDGTKGLSSIQQIYITLEVKKNNMYESDDQVTHIGPYRLSSLKN